MNYQELTEAILTESLRSDLTAQVPLFVLRAEEMIARELRASEMLDQVVLTDADLVNPADPGIYRLPDDWLEDRAVTWSSTTLRKLSSSAIPPLRRASVPVAYAVRGTASGWTLEVRGAPGEGSTVELEYFQRPAHLVDPTDTTRLLTNHPGVYVDAALFHLYRYTQDLELAQAALDTWGHTRDTLNEQAGRFLGGSQSTNRYNMGRFSVGGGF